MAKDKPKKLSAKPTSAAPANKSNAAKPVEQPAQSAILQDARFQHLVADPRFKKLPQTQRKVKIDKRFQSMFTDDKFNVKYQVDKYGRRITKSNAEDLRKYYELESGSGSSDEDDEANIEEEQRKEEKAITRASDESDSESATNDEAASDENDELQSDTDVPQSLKERLLDPDIDYARGEGRLMTDSSSDDESSEDEDPELLIDHVWGELDNEAETTEESTKRLAVCNMDWDRIRAADLMVLFSSFLPPGGSILSVTIYPSQFGKERMAEEDKYGPIELQGLGKADKPKEQNADAASESDDDEELVKAVDSDVEEGDDYHMEKLRQYQLNRLRYYYAVVVCDSVATADKIYKECDGIEYESSATRVDLRFIPDDTSFDDDEPTDKCTELPDASNYQPRQFTTTALQQAKVDLTWDETAVERRELGDKLASGKLDEIDDKELRKIVAYSSEEDGDEDDNETNEKEVPEIKQQSKETKQQQGQPAAGSKKNKKDDAISKYKALLAEINEKEKQEKEKKYEKEFTWNVEETKAEKDDKDQEVTAADSKSKLTPIERVLQKRSEKNKKRKEERKKKKLQAKGIDPDNYNSDDDSDSIPDGIDMNDPYFAEEFQDGEFEKPKTKAKSKKQKQRVNGEQDDEELEKQAKELALLVDDEDEDDGKQHFSLEKIMKAEQETKSKKKRRKQLKKSKSSIADERKEIEDNFQINLNDQRFQAVYKSPLFNIDPTASHFKKTKGMEQLIQEKLKRRHGEGANEKSTVSNTNGAAVENGDEQASKRPKKQLENTLLIKSLKRKIQMKQQIK